MAYLALLLATGLNHLDGLADVAAALVVRDRESPGRFLKTPIGVLPGFSPWWRLWR